MKIKILHEAEKDLEEAYRFYESQSSDLGLYFLDSLYSDIDSLTYFAGIHPVVFGSNRLLSKRFPFAVYYRTIDDAVVIFAILDCRRNPISTMKRLKKG